MSIQEKNKLYLKLRHYFSMKMAYRLTVLISR